MEKMDTLNYYLKLPYKFEIEPITQEEGGGYVARLSQFGSLGVVGDGETIEEAITNLNSIKEVVFKRLIEKGSEIPKPEHDISKYSGRILTRIPKELHAKLIEDARINSVSLNQHINYLLSSRIDLPLRDILKAIETKIETCVSEIPEKFYDKSSLLLKKLAGVDCDRNSQADGFKDAA